MTRDPPELFVHWSMQGCRRRPCQRRFGRGRSQATVRLQGGNALRAPGDQKSYTPSQSGTRRAGTALGCPCLTDALSDARKYCCEPRALSRRLMRRNLTRIARCPEGRTRLKIPTPKLDASFPTYLYASQSAFRKNLLCLSLSLLSLTPWLSTTTEDIT